MNWWDRLFKKKNPIFHFERIRIEELLVRREYCIYSDDGAPDSHIVLKLESLSQVIARIRDQMLANPGNIERFKTLYGDYFFIKFWQMQTYNCDRRLSLYRRVNGNNKLAWTLDFHAPNVPDSKLLKRLFREIAAQQFVEDSDWYHHLLSLNWESFFIDAVGQYDLACVKPVKRALIRKQEINEAMRLHWKRAGIGEVSVSRNAPDDKSPIQRIPYEEIAKMVLDKRNPQPLQ